MTDYLARAMEQDEETGRELSEELRDTGMKQVVLPAREGSAPGTGGTSERRAAGTGRLEARTSLRREGDLPEPGGEPSPGAAASPAERRQAAPLLEEGVGLRAPPAAGDPALPLLNELRRARTGTDFVRRERRSFSVTLPEMPAVPGGLTAEELDRTVERDARRYGGGFELY